MSASFLSGMWKCPTLIIWLQISFKFQFPSGPMACLRLPLWLPTWDALLLQWNIRASLRPGSCILVWSYIYKYKVQGSWRIVQNLPSSFTKKRANTTQNLAQQFCYFIFKFGFDWSGGSYKHSQDSAPIVSFLHFVRKLFVEFHLAHTKFKAMKCYSTPAMQDLSILIQHVEFV